MSCSRLTPDQIQVKISWTVRSATAGNLLNINDGAHCSGKKVGGTTGSGEEGGDGELICAEEAL